MFKSRIKSTIKVFSVLLAVLMLTAFVPLSIETPVEAAGNVYYVAKNGNDSNPGTEALPWRTIQKAANTLTAGDTVYVKAGTYNEQVVPANSGSAGNWITYRVFPGDTVTIDGSGINIGKSPSGSVQGLFFIKNNHNYIEVNGFRIINSTCHGVSVYQSCDHITLKNLYIAETGSCGVFVSSTWNSADLHPTNILIDGVECYHTNGDHDRESITMVCVDGFEIRNCKIHDTIFKGSLEWPCQNGINPQGCKNGSIHDNEVYRVMDGIYIGAHFNDPTSSNIDIYNNFVHDCYWPTHNLGIGLTVGVETVEGSTISDINFYNNIVTGNFIGFLDDLMGNNNFNVNYRLINNTFWHNAPGNGAMEICIKKNASYHNNCVIRNNIIVGQYSGTVLLRYDDYANGGVTIDHNLFYCADGYVNANKYGTNYIQANPLLVNPTANFNIASNSPARDAGSSSGAPSFDYTGESRPQGAGIDIGAYEYAGSGVSSNRAPVLNSIGNKSVTAGQTLSFTISATDPDGDNLTYSASNLPAGASFNASTRTFSWTPYPSQPGYYHDIRFQVSDGSLTDSESITITVNQPVVENRAPVLNPVGNKTVTAGQTLSFTISATDPDGDSLTYSAFNLPAGAGFNASTRTFTWTPAAGQVGYYQNIRFQVSDGSLSDSKNINITVAIQQEPAENAGDINQDGKVNASDKDIVVQHWGESGSPGWIAADVNLDGKISALDLILIGQNWTGD